MVQASFTGFPKQTLEFLRGLERNNDKKWFDAHRKDYDDHLIAPARAFVSAMGARLQQKVPGIQADPRTNKSIFRINRDTRFSKDKSPYKTNLAIMFWEGDRKRMECPSFYFHLEADKLMLGAGLYMFQKDQLAEYRRSVDDRKLAGRLEKALKGHVKRSCEATHIEPYKRVPRGFDPGHPRAELLKLKGLTLGDEGRLPKALHSARFLDYAYRRFEKMAALHEWLVALNRRVA
jgi:uncharacterized protein (TIGR02453 family)